MKIIKSAMILPGILFFSMKGYTQDRDTIPKMVRDSTSIRRRVITYAADKFAIARPLNIEFSHSAPYNYSSEAGGLKLPESRVTNFSQVKVSANINFLKRKTWLLGSTLGYRYTAVAADVTQSGTGNLVPVENDYHYHFSTLNLVYFSSLFGKRTIYSATGMVDGSEKYFERLKGIFTGTMVLKANQRTKMTIGVIVNLDPSSQSPVIPSFSYEHKFNNGLLVDINLPRSLYLRKYVFGSGRVSLGTEMDQSTFYLYDIDGSSQKYEYRQLDINSGLTYEHVVAKKFVFTAKTGMKLTPSGRIFKKEDGFGDPVFKTKPAPTYYLNIGVSFNPFSILGKKK